jgi:hypothetical protein
VHALEEGQQIEIDGRLDEKAWLRAAATRRFVDVKTGRPNKTFPVNGRVKVAYDTTHLYLGFEIEDKDVTGGFPKNAKDPQLWTRDTVEIMIDPEGNGDNKDYYEIQLSPQNLVFDSRFDDYNEPKGSKDGPFGHQEWSSGVESAVTVKGTLDKPDDVDEGYVVEAKIPWKAFDKAKKIPPEPGSTWRINFYAIQQNSGVAWSPILGKGNFHKAARFGRVTWKERGFRSAAERLRSGPLGMGKERFSKLKGALKQQRPVKREPSGAKQKPTAPNEP